MVTDTNIGSNKTNAAVDMSLVYEVDLSDITAPAGRLTLQHTNRSNAQVSCSRWEPRQVVGDEWYPIERCYWTYTRVYKQTGVELLDATPHAIPADWTLLHENVPAGIDALEEELAGAQGFGTLLVVPGQETRNTSFEFALPASVLSASTDLGSYTYSYRLRVQKQPGTLANPMTIRIVLPEHAVLNATLPGAVLQDNLLLLETSLRTDVVLEIRFSMPLDTE